MESTSSKHDEGRCRRPSLQVVLAWIASVWFVNILLKDTNLERSVFSYRTAKIKETNATSKNGFPAGNHTNRTIEVLKETIATSKNGFPAGTRTIEDNVTVTTSVSITNSNSAAAKKELYRMSGTELTTVRQTIFYHIFIPIVGDKWLDWGPTKVYRPNATRVIQIIEEQLGQVNQAQRDASKSTSLTTAVFYNTIGGALDPQVMNRICRDNNLQCRHIGHHEGGYEEVTLQSVKDFCAINPTQNVVYMHNKGSFSSHDRNENLRRSMTAAVTSPLCLNSVLANRNNNNNNNNNETDSICNTCGLVFMAIRGPFYPGNFWTAKCSYINSLLDPYTYANQSSIMAKEALSLRDRGVVVMKAWEGKMHTLGLDRFANELWIGSHPSILPCDLTTSFDKWNRKTATEGDFKLRPPILRPKEKPPQKTKYEDRIREYFYLAGHIFRWYHCYGKVPAADSWFWTNCPDGAEWKNAVAQHGPHAVYVMTNFSNKG